MIGYGTQAGQGGKINVKKRDGEVVITPAGCRPVGLDNGWN